MPTYLGTAYHYEFYVAPAYQYGLSRAFSELKAQIRSVFGRGMPRLATKRDGRNVIASLDFLVSDHPTLIDNRSCYCPDYRLPATPEEMLAKFKRILYSGDENVASLLERELRMMADKIHVLNEHPIKTEGQIIDELQSLPGFLESSKRAIIHYT